MHSQRLATVAMVTYNSEKYISAAIESVLSQSHDQLELLICDDCSTDGTWDLVQSYRDPRIRAHRNEKNLGEYANRNRALELARGEFILYIDGDDILYPHGLEFMVRMLAAFPAAAMAMACPWSEKFLYPVELNSREFFLCQFLGPNVSAINFAHLLLRTDTLRKVGGLDTRYRSGDTYIQYRLALEHSCVLISDGLAWWRRTPGQASEGMLRDNVLQTESLGYRDELLKHPQCPLTSAEIEQAYSNIYGGFIRLLLRFALRGRVAHALKLLRRSRLPWRAWKYALVRGSYPYMSEVTAAQPRASSPEQNPFAHLPTS